jgi:hypothetical protein
MALVMVAGSVGMKRGIPGDFIDVVIVIHRQGQYAYMNNILFCILFASKMATSE